MEVGKAVEQLWPGKSLSCISNVPYPDGLFFLSLFFFFMSMSPSKLLYNLLILLSVSPG